jgi:hypothetical protein
MVNIAYYFHSDAHLTFPRDREGQEAKRDKALS